MFIDHHHHLHHQIINPSFDLNSTPQSPPTPSTSSLRSSSSSNNPSSPIPTTTNALSILLINNNSTLDLIINPDSVSIKFNSTPSWSPFFTRSNTHHHQINFTYQNILNSTLSVDPSDSTCHRFSFSALKSTNSFDHIPFTLNGTLNQQACDLDHAKLWIEIVLSRAYQHLPRSPRLLVIVNPYGGSGKGHSIYNSIVQPIFNASAATTQSIITTHSGHAAEIGSSLDPNNLDVVVCVSGDGSVHELINGIGRRPDASDVFKKISIASIPAGSGNALSVNQMGPANGSNPILASLTVLKGKPCPLDLCSVTQLNDNPDQEPFRSLSFLSTAFGLMADLDIGTESWRWMGGSRFILGYLRGAFANRYQTVRLDMQVIDHDKHSIHQNWQNLQKLEPTELPLHTTTDSSPHQPDSQSQSPDHHPSGLPALVYGDVRKAIEPDSHGRSPDGWTTITLDVTSIYAGTLPFMAADLLEFPVKIPGDGSIDLIVHQSPNVLRTLKCVQGADQGSMFRNDDCQYFKTRAFRLTPIPKPRRDRSEGIQEDKSYIVIDGENQPYRPIQVEIHDGLAKVLSLNCDRLGQFGVPDSMLD